MSSSRRGDPVKVVIINTEYIKTDALNFKSVVQRLTGKDSLNPAFSLKDKLSHGGTDDGRVGMNSRMSFRDLDKLLLELPIMDDDMYQFCVD
ncbi:hypothetical protein QVD17_19346 [Tagetes erecta]|uniref:VQ domain-containing protein n=1 Tax=Tagetes erecta TaxID=13708 RepID=A0AAD8NPZ3_TARER|nr:hypothetical protein QVD17_19346 [Tagetes erecta]